MPLASGGRIRYSAKTKRKVVSNRIEFTFFSAFSYLLMPVACNPVPVLVADMYGVLVISVEQVWPRPRARDDNEPCHSVLANHIPFHTPNPSSPGY